MIDYTEDDNSGKYQSCSPSTCSFYENPSREQSYFEIVVEEIPLHVDQIHISPNYLHDFMKISLLEEDDQPSDLKGDGCTDLFSEECNQTVMLDVMFRTCQYHNNNIIYIKMLCLEHAIFQIPIVPLHVDP